MAYRYPERYFTLALPLSFGCRPLPCFGDCFGTLKALQAACNKDLQVSSHDCSQHLTPMCKKDGSRVDNCTTFTLFLFAARQPHQCRHTPIPQYSWLKRMHSQSYGNASDYAFTTCLVVGTQSASAQQNVFAKEAI